MIRAALLSLLALSAVPAAGDSPAGGSATVSDVTRDAFSQPAPSLSRQHRAAFFVGNSFFNQSWVQAPASVTNRDGLGPLFNARSCSGCHFKDGRSRPPPSGQPMETMLLRISVPGQGPHGAPLPDPTYGDQIQGNAIAGLNREADVVVEYRPLPHPLPDGESLVLRQPRYRLAHLAYGPASPKLLTSPRVAPAMIGLGLLEAVPASALEALADPDDRDGDGISGRLNQVWDTARQRPAPGRFGWKAEQPSVLQQSAGAFAGDMGITSSLFPAENHTAREKACAGQPSGGQPEVSDDILQTVALYARTLGVPARRDGGDARVRRGEALFVRARCNACHVATLHTEALPDLPELGGQTIHPYTDLLLHDLGAGLSDERPAFAAGGREWRTAPLWGVGLVPAVNGHSEYLHDGRARNLTEAVLWHDGEARAAREAFERLDRADRGALIAFVESL
jgi:CxxC motif-containing protein (DUF1111 family)